MLYKYLPIIALLMAPSALVVAQSTSAITWQKDLDAARAMAERDQKLLLVHFYNDNCSPCRMLDATVFNQPTVAGAVHSHYVPVKLNTNDFPATAERFGITRVPTDVVITPQGQVIKRMISPATPMDYITQTSSLAQEHHRQMARNLVNKAQVAGTSQPASAAIAAFPVQGDNNSFTNQPVAGAPSVTSNPHALMAMPAANQVAQQTQQTAAAPRIEVTPIDVPNPYTTPAQPAAPPQPPVSQVAMAEPAQVPAVPSATPPAAPAQTPAAAQPAVASAAPQLPAGSPPVGFFGYCPVTMKNEGRWQKGDVQWGCYHRGRTYLFASQAARDQFFANGDAYAPALSGIDPVAAIDSGRVVEGKSSYLLECGGQLYLFESEENLAKFSSQADRYVAGIRQAMAQAPTGQTLR
ncbi:thioredoxin family protein [Aeoliella mucimassa]|uniref:Thiol:disulfide interchange protein DsbD n=1 Tax=Aeoliella mucimassa TaxID=2527972 RepID=A0A518AM23_9BACT|nr:thioredoxin family protein [Aeoliella mucimassa]QDU55769.1 Thiol:disulfide interchange protein DsbD [Aeoliella mucimassa]